MSANLLRDSSRHSIDMSLELEHQLDDDDALSREHGHANDSRERRVSLDAVILSGIIANLRKDTEELTNERTVLVDTIAQSTAREAELKEALAIFSERCSNLENEVAELQKKSRDDDDAIALLRSKVEESRRGLMRLQTESKRMSMSIDTSRAPSSFFSGPSSSKRASFTPLTGSGVSRINSHRRTSSISEPPPVAGDGDSDVGGSPNAQNISLPDYTASRSDEHLGSMVNHRLSGLFGYGVATAQQRSPPVNTLSLASEPPDAIAAQLEAVTRERDEVRAALERARMDLAEAQDSREASEHCVTALRQFISENAVGEVESGRDRRGSIKLPPLPTDATVDEDAEEAGSRRSFSSGWSLKLWRVETNGASSASKGSTHDPVSPAVSPPAEISPESATPTIPFSKKLGSIFSPRTSVSSANTPPPLPPRRPAGHGQQEPILNGSDCSSIDEPEPMSPVAESVQTRRDVIVRAVSQGSTVSAEIPRPLAVVEADGLIPKPPPKDVAQPTHEPVPVPVATGVPTAL